MTTDQSFIASSHMALWIIFTIETSVARFGNSLMDCLILCKILDRLSQNLLGYWAKIIDQRTLT